MAAKYTSGIFEKKVPIETMYLGEDGLLPLEVKFHHDPDSTHGFCGAALSSNVIHWWRDEAENGSGKRSLMWPMNRIQNGPFRCRG